MEATSKAVLVTGEAVEVVAVNGGWIKVRLPDGTERNVRQKQIKQATNEENEMSKHEDGYEYEDEAAEAEAVEAAESEESEEKPSRVSMAALIPARLRYVKGKRSMICGDPVSVALDGLSPDQKRNLAVRLSQGSNKPVDYSAWSHLNGGQMAMNAANVIRRLVKTGVVTTGDLIKAANALMPVEEAEQDAEREAA
jgi:hypothetical protein